MSDGSRSTSKPPWPQTGGAGSARTARLLRIAVYVVLLGAVGIVAYASFRAKQDRDHVKETEDVLLRWHGMLRPAAKHLAPEYSDKHGRLLADPPADPKLLVDPDTLVLAHYVDVDADAQPVDWDGLQAQVAKATGKKVVGQEYWNDAEDVALLKSGKIQIIALHAADTPHLVNNAGFVPVANLGTEAGPHGNHLVLAVAPDSKIEALADLRGQKLTCTRPDSITGYRAAIAVLLREAGLRPDVDYTIIWSYSQKQSILGLARGDVEAAALSDDKLQSMLKDGSIKASDYRVVYRSQVIPRLTIGYAYNLEPELAAKVLSALLEFDNAAGPAEESTGKPMRFFAMDYQQDFEFARAIDDSFDPRFRGRPKANRQPDPAAEGELAP